MKITYILLDKDMTYEAYQSLTALLSPARREKIARLRFDGDKLRSLAAGLLLRRVIGDRSVTLGEHGKPYCDGVCFSLSHSGAMVAVGVDGAQIGIDVEKIAEEDRLRIAGRFFHPAERAYVQAASDQRRAFCEIWTRKEAYLKMTGEGISRELTGFDTTSPPLSRRLMTTRIGDYCLSVCSENLLNDKIDISESELNDLV